MVISLNKNFWKNKSVLVTGHTGFKGAWLSLWLKSLDTNLIGYSLSPPTEPNLFTLANISSGMTSINGDICNLENLKLVLKRHKPEIVIHMAAQSLVRKSYLDPIETYSTNVIGTANVLEAIKQIGSTKVALVVTSDKCYENKEKEWDYSETEPLGGYDPYSSSKGCAELVTSAYRRSFFSSQAQTKNTTHIASARSGNVIGGGDWSNDRLIPDVIKSITKNQKLIIRNPNAIRPWQHVLEPLGGYLLLVENLWNNNKFSSSWNFGPKKEDCKKVSWIVECFIKLWGENVRWEIDVNENPHEANYLRLDCAKAKEELGWEPSWNIEKALSETVNWYKSFKEKKNLEEFSLSQIKEYQKESLKV